MDRYSYTILYISLVIMVTSTCQLVAEKLSSLSL